jgi:hypothetical protein
LYSAFILVICYIFYFPWLSECITGRYGINGESHCHTCVNKICDRLDGSCSHGGIDGFRGVGCYTTGIPAHGAIDMS